MDVPPSTSIDGLLAAIAREWPVLRELGIRRLELFGSRARNEARVDSDVDLLAEFAPGRDLVDLVSATQHLEAVLGLPVDLITPSGMHPEARDSILRDLREVE
jgi:predicted nucleotidyltransferase